MNLQERTLLTGALRSAKILLVHGTVSSEAEIVGTLGQLLPGLKESWDLRALGDNADGAELYGEAAHRLESNPSLLILLSSEAPKALRDLIAAMDTGKIELGDQKTFELDEKTRVVALLADGTPTEELCKTFPLQVVGMRLLNEAANARAAAEQSLSEAQARARQSSIDHGLV